jgi:hypothetical protein
MPPIVEVVTPGNVAWGGSDGVGPTRPKRGVRVACVTIEGLMIRLVTGLVVVIALFVGGDFALRLFTEARAEARMKEVLDLRSSPDVSIGGWPFILKVVGGNFPSVSVTASDARFSGVELEQIEISLREVELSFASLLRGSDDVVRIAGGTGRVLLTGASLSQALRREGISARIRLGSDGTVVIRDDRLPEPVTGELKLEGNSLVIEADGLPQSYAVSLPEVVDGLHYDSLVVDGSGASIGFSLDAGRLVAG